MLSLPYRLHAALREYAIAYFTDVGDISTKDWTHAQCTQCGGMWARVDGGEKHSLDCLVRPTVLLEAIGP